MKKLMTTGVASLVLISAAFSAAITPAEARYYHRGGGLVAGAVIGLTAAAIIANSSRADAGEHRRWRARCDRFAYRCNHGEDRACYAFDDQCRG